MLFRVTKTVTGLFDTALERRRIMKAFRRDKYTRKHLLELMGAIEAENWLKAGKLLKSKWWQGRDKKLECPSVEFIGLLDLQDEKRPGHPAFGFDPWVSYMGLVETLLGHNFKYYKVEKVKVDTDGLRQGSKSNKV